MDIMENTQTNTQDIITSDEQYIDKLANIGKTAGYTDFSLLADRETIDTKEKEVLDFIKDTTSTQEAFEQAIEKWNEYKDLVKNAICRFDLNNLEVKTVDKKLFTSVEYDKETLFYGLHLKKTFIDTLPVVKGNEYKMNPLTITFTNAMALYHVLSTLTVKGLNKENYAFANILYKLSEISKVYQWFDSASSRMSQSIGQWSMGLTEDAAKELTVAIQETVKAETAEISA